MKFLRVLLAIGLFMVAGPALADKDGPVVSGYWEGNGQAIYPDGTLAQITLVQALLSQDGNFIYGGAQFTVVLGGNEPMMQEAQMSGSINGNALKGAMGGCFPEAPNCIGAGIFEGKISGEKLTGTIVDLSDGSTSVITLHKFTD